MGSGTPLGQSLARGALSRVIDLQSVSGKETVRFSTNINEFDRCLGGGIVPGSAVLLGGDPGVGKSTLALQIAQSLLASKVNILYVAGEESPAQIKMRAERLNDKDLLNLSILADTNLLNILATSAAQKPNLLIIDSIQTIYNPEANGVPGSVAQVSGAAAKLVELAKTHNIAMILIGHVTKEGYIAGPKMLEHMVDVVLYLEGERFQSLRLLRAVKNRFGGINEVGVFEMTGAGMSEVANPSKLFLDEQISSRSGAAFTAIMEGTRVVACEIQALLSKSTLAYPKRTSVGFDLSRLWLILAVLAKHGKLPVHEQDVYINVVGGLKISEPASDLPVALSMISSLLDTPVSAEIVSVGEIGLSGEIRPVSQFDRRASEVERLGFSKMVIPARQNPGKTKLELIRVGDIRELIQKLFGKK